MEQEFHVGMKALFLNGKNEVLVLKKNPEHGIAKTTGVHWDIPGGRIKPRAGIEDTLRRELEEEIAIAEFEVIRLFDAVISNITSHGNKTRLLLVIYLCKLGSNARITLNPEHTEYRWASIREAKALLATKFPKGFLDRLESL